MNNKECFDAVCALSLGSSRVGVYSGYARQCELLGGEIGKEYMICAFDSVFSSRVGFQAVFDEFKKRIGEVRRDKIIDLKKQITVLENQRISEN